MEKFNKEDRSQEPGYRIPSQLPKKSLNKKSTQRAQRFFNLQSWGKGQF
jgi:hypothetical protein